MSAGETDGIEISGLIVKPQTLAVYQEMKRATWAQLDTKSNLVQDRVMASCLQRLVNTRLPEQK